ncbi:MAG: hypothetical protein HY840_03295 [Bacteroidetes bacterium]|nr:hypothetical protein [Bacteroidota bacterium]
MKKTVVVLKLSRLSISEKIAKGRFIVTSMTGNVNFTTPSPAMPVITTNVNTLEAASIISEGGGTDDTAAMHARELTLDLSLKSLAAYVEGIANANPLNAEAIILSAGMDVKTPAVHTAREFNVSATNNPGEIKMSTKHVLRSTCIFQMCTDTSNESNWQTIAQSTRAKFVKSGLISGTRYFFRAGIIDKNGMSPWSNVLNSIAL